MNIKMPHNIQESNTLTEMLTILHSQSTEEKKEKNNQWFKQNNQKEITFIGVSHKVIDEIVKNFHPKINIQTDIPQLLSSIYHEEKMLGIKLSNKIFAKNKKNPQLQRELFDICFKQINNYNQWDLIDTISTNLLGAYLTDFNSKEFQELYNSNDWIHQRILLVSQLYNVRKEQNIQEILNLCTKYFDSTVDLIQKALGWVLKESFEYTTNDLKTEVKKFIEENTTKMSKLTARIAKEKF
jgi:3-methyladenine DNA glycosylase AlkD